MVPMLTWGFLRSNLPRAALTVKEARREGKTEVVETVVMKGGRKEEERWGGASLEGIEEKTAEVVGERVGKGEGRGYRSLEEVTAADDEIAISL
ncbi:hypothetical protein V6N11_068212 [Hibiscus sabdariffa]|uniref:Uncharacterized protein n=1 Tax=Hibiscus sabdariffa TaxID=183260 RepID=A0ABR2ST08_9ROSI